MATLKVSQPDLFLQELAEKLVRIHDLMAHMLGEMKAAQEVLRKIITLSADCEEKSGDGDSQQQG